MSVNDLQTCRNLELSPKAILLQIMGYMYLRYHPDKSDILPEMHRIRINTKMMQNGNKV